jgi:undecaprenyl-diphosphatase
VQLFYFINNWAGRSELLDAALRFFYVGAIPLLATLLVAILFFAPGGTLSRRRVALAAGCAALLCVVALPVLNAFARTFLDAEILSPRPFVTHRVNLLVIEPNDNSFPCPEAMLAAALATTLLALSPRLGIGAWLAAALLALTRIICGSNYVADVLVGLFLGGAIAGLCLALCGVPLQFALRDGRRLTWQPRYQAVFSGAALAITCVGVLFAFEQSARFGPKVRGLVSGIASAAPLKAQGGDYSTLSSHEGEGMTGQRNAPSSPADTTGDQHRSDFIPQADDLLRSAWAPLKLPHRILSVDVAQVRVGTSPYRSAVVRFIVEKRGPQERASVLSTATKLIRAAYHADGQLQNIDVVGVMINAKPSDYGPRPLTTPGPLPVFSASVVRRDLGGTRQLPANLATSNPGAGEPAAAWLRARSLLFINDTVLPRS